MEIKKEASVGGNRHTEFLKTLQIRCYKLKHNGQSFYNDRRVSLIPPPLIDDKFVTDIQTKTNIFNRFLLTNVNH